MEHVKRGRKPRDPIEICRTAFWAWTVREKLGKSFDQIEREFNPDCFWKRDDGGGFVQPGRWRAYGAGRSDPVGSHRSKIKAGTHLQQASELYPDSLNVYNSVLWAVLRTPDLKENQAKTWINDLEPNAALRLMCYYPDASSPWDSFLLLHHEDLAHFAVLQTLDVMAALLIYLRLTSPNPDLATIWLIRAWLTSSFHRLLPFKKTRHLFFPVIEACAPELGPMTGRFGLSHTKSEDQQYFDIVYGSIFHSGLRHLPIVVN
jgi:hypothetical protein